MKNHRSVGFSLLEFTLNKTRPNKERCFSFFTINIGPSYTFYGEIGNEAKSYSFLYINKSYCGWKFDFLFLRNSIQDFKIYMNGGE